MSGAELSNAELVYLFTYVSVNLDICVLSSVLFIHLFIYIFD